MAQLKRYNGTSWETVGGVVTGDTLPIGSEVDYNGASAPAGWEEISNDLVVDSIRTKNMFYGGLEQGSFNAQTAAETDVGTRVRSRYIELEKGTYTISVSNVGYGVVLYVFDTNNTYINAESEVNWQSLPYTFTLTNKRRIRIAIRNANNNSIVPSDVQNLMIEKGSSATTYKPFQNLNGYNNYSKGEQIVGTWIDGKTLYKKVIIPSSPISVTANTWTTITSLSNINDITDYFAILSYNIYGSYLCRMDNGNFQVYFKDTLSIKAVIIEYTKTTD